MIADTSTPLLQKKYAYCWLSKAARPMLRPDTGTTRMVTSVALAGASRRYDARGVHVTALIHVVDKFASLEPIPTLTGPARFTFIANSNLVGQQREGLIGSMHCSQAARRALAQVRVFAVKGAPWMGLDGRYLLIADGCL